MGCSAFAVLLGVATYSAGQDTIALIGSLALPRLLFGVNARRSFLSQNSNEPQPWAQASGPRIQEARVLVDAIPRRCLSAGRAARAVG